MTSSLEGRVVVTTRADRADDALVEALTARGARVVVWPTIRFQPSSDSEALAGALAVASTFDWILFTSPRSVEVVTAGLERRPSGPRIAAVGASTATSLDHAGWTPDVVGDDGARSMIGAIAKREQLAGAKVLYPASALADGTVEAEVERLGGRMLRVDAYTTVASPPPRASILEDLESGVDVVTFASPSAIDSLASELGDAWPHALTGCGIATIGPTTTAALVERGIDGSRIEVAKPTGLDGLVRAVVRALPRGNTETASAASGPLTLNDSNAS